ncbi:MAG: transport system ATP-binding/permease protein [Thermoleophilaceae bacterium]|jgi:ABC-type multidrug transport system ATPase subunit/pSer/pThr/pTyr-binding forkhead associated (FHA) protein|nr:transport system ATP-binding/permease protein [Thermoleophilaceae bacterium]
MLEEPGEFVVGRGVDAHVRLDDARVSRRHVVLRASNGGWVLEDESKAGTFFAGQRVERMRIPERATVRLGNREDGPLIEFELVGANSDEEGATRLGAASESFAGTTLGETRGEMRPGSGELEIPDFAKTEKAARDIRIGRAPDNDLVLDDDLLVSRHHAELRVLSKGGFELVDLGSSNGTFVNGRRIDRTELEELDVVSIGQHVYRLTGNELEPYVDVEEVALQALGLTVTTPEGQTLLKDVSFAIPERAFMAVVGPSGAGKTTLLNALTGFRPAGKGRILYGERDLYAEYDELRTRIGFVPQQDVVHDTLTVEQALEYAGELRFAPDVDENERTTRIDEVIAELGLEPCRSLPIRRLSGGQRRRVSVGIELITKPSLLILDEPTSGLDPGLERSLMELLRQLADGGRTVVVVTHSVQSLRLCDRVLFLAPGGRMAYFGPAQMAPAYFGREDFQEVFRDLSSSDRDWSTEFLEHSYYERYVLPRDDLPEAKAAQRTFSLPSPRNWFTQFWMQTRRYTRVIASDRRNVAMLILQPAVLGLIMMLALPAHELSRPDPGIIRIASRGGLVLLVVMLGMTWLGASNAIREIVREQPIFMRERAVGLFVSSYVSSKVVVLGSLTILQAFILVPIAVARQSPPSSGSFFPNGVVELIVVGALAGLAAMALGLVLSSLSETADRAMTVLPVVLIVQMLLAMGGVFPDLVDKPGLKQASYLAGAQWAFSASASTVDLDHLMSVDRVARSYPQIHISDPGPALAKLTDEKIVDRLWRHDWKTWSLSAGALLLLTALGILGTGEILRRRRPSA